MWKPTPLHVLVWLAAAAWEIYSFLGIVLFDGAGDVFAEALSVFIVACFVIGLLIRGIDEAASACLELFWVGATAAALSIFSATISGEYAQERMTIVGFSVVLVWAGAYLVAAATAILAGGICSQALAWLWRKIRTA